MILNDLSKMGLTNLSTMSQLLQQQAMQDLLKADQFKQPGFHTVFHYDPRYLMFLSIGLGRLCWGGGGRR